MTVCPKCGHEFDATPEPKRKRFVLEGTWSGYTSAQRRICHRVVLTEKQAERARKLSGITYTDGTTLDLTVRQLKRGESVTEIKSYCSLIESALAHGGNWVNVGDLHE